MDACNLHHKYYIKPPWFSGACATAKADRNHFFCINLCLKLSSDRVVIVAKEFLNLPNMVILIKQESITYEKLGCHNFWRTANSVPSKGKTAFPHVFNDLGTLMLTDHIILYLVSLLKRIGNCIIFL